MKQLIKSATVFNAELPSAENLRTHFEGDLFIEPLATQAISLGFVPRTEGGTLVSEFTGGVAFTVRIDQKILPGSVVKAAAAVKAKALEVETGRKVGKKWMREIRLRTEEELLARALIRTQVITCFHHTATNMLVIPMTNKSLVQRIVSLLVNSVGSVKTTTINVANVKGGLTKRLKDWVMGDIGAFGGLDPVNEVQLEQGERKVTVRMSDLDASRAALTEALGQDHGVKALGLQFASGLELKLTDDFKFRGIVSPTPEVVEGEEKDDALDTFHEQAAIELADLTDAITFLCEMFGYKEETANE